LRSSRRWLALARVRPFFCVRGQNRTNRVLVFSLLPRVFVVSSFRGKRLSPFERDECEKHVLSSFFSLCGGPPRFLFFPPQRNERSEPRRRTPSISLPDLSAYVFWPFCSVLEVPNLSVPSPPLPLFFPLSPPPLHLPSSLRGLRSELLFGLFPPSLFFSCFRRRDFFFHPSLPTSLEPLFHERLAFFRRECRKYSRVVAFPLRLPFSRSRSPFFFSFASLSPPGSQALVPPGILTLPFVAKL